MTNCGEIVISETAVINKQGERQYLIQRYDECAENPRTLFKHSSKFFTWLSNFASPDKAPSYADWVNELHVNGYDGDAKGIVQKLNAHGIVVMMVFMKQYGEVLYRATEGENPFISDEYSGFVGFIYITNKDIRKEFGVNKVTKAVREKAQEMLKKEVEQYSDWASGKVYRWTLEDAEGQEINAIGNIYGNDLPCDYFCVSPVPES